jgi:lactoylglutathione lyase
MHLEHIAMWTHDLERLRGFYETYFNATSGEKYTNPSKHFQSYFLSFETGARLEIMQMDGIPKSLDNVQRQFTGYIHMAISVGSEAAVDELANRLSTEGYPLIDGPRRTGDGYYEAVIFDPDGNRVEITV